ncbi:unnamed protein product [Clonostachys solani]|uniref:Kinesin light chain n=1 Tax=Clonostachys solani TaxID=160281 RepID=A0A9N9ZK83_9HYPO|nr:unnamed protein product [Clonostachys solani]
MPTPKLAETAWGCLGQSLNDHKPLEGLDLGALLVGNCSATAQWCSTSKLELVQFDTNWTELGRLCERHSNYETAAELYEAGRKRQCEIYPGPNMYQDYFKDSIRVCHTYMLAGSQRAEEEIQKLWDKVEKTNSVSQSLNYLKICRHDDSASFLLERCLLSCENQRSINRPTTLSLLKSLADMSFEQGELRRAEDYYTQAQNLAEQWLGRQHPEVAIRQAMCGVTAGLRGHHGEAMEIFREAVQLARETFPENHRFVVRLHLRWALSMAVEGRYAEAKTNLNNILEALDQTINVVDPQLLHQTLTILNKYFWTKKDRIELEAIWNHVLESDAFSSSSWAKLSLESADGCFLVYPSSTDNSCSDTTAYSRALDSGEQT